METAPKISDYRTRLDRTLASPDLTDRVTLKALVSNHLQQSSSSSLYKEGSHNLLEKRTMELANFLDMLRSASSKDNGFSRTRETSHAEWKLKHDTEKLRTMYREGPPGTRYHSLLIEGCIDEPADVCLCVSLESTLYGKWWPQFVIPTFKIVSSKCLQKVRAGEQISIVRVKIPWPFSPREAVVHYFVFEYLQEDLIVILINTISDFNSIDTSTLIINDGIPESTDAVRLSLSGGFAFQKVTSERTYLRQIGNVDFKMDFVPPSLVNFISRQLIGEGFRLYAKAVTSAYKGDEDYRKVLSDPMYTRIRGECNSIEKPYDAHEVHYTKSMEDDSMDIDRKVQKDYESESLDETMVVTCKKGNKAFGEITEMEDEDKPSEEIFKTKGQYPINKTTGKCSENSGENSSISREVEQALVTLEKVISMVREHGYSRQTRNTSDFPNEGLPKVDYGEAKTSFPSNSKVCAKESKVEIMDQSPREISCRYDNNKLRPLRSSSYSKEIYHNKVAPASPETYISDPSETHQVAMCSSTAKAHVKTEHDHKQLEDRVIYAKNQKIHRLCCVSFTFGRF